jgi:TonB family protein
MHLGAKQGAHTNMKKHCLLCASFLAFFCRGEMASGQSAAVQQTQVLCGGQPEDFVRGRLYGNRRLMFTYELPEGWVEQKTHATRELKMLREVFRAARSDSAMDSEAVKISITEVSAVAGVFGTNHPSSRELAEDLSKAFPWTSNAAGTVMPEQKVDGITFSTVRGIISTAEGGEERFLQIELAVTVFREYALEFTFYGTTEAVLEGAVKTLDSFKVMKTDAHGKGLEIPPGLTPELLRHIDPEYPALARSSRIEGDVEVKIHVGLDGQVIEAEAIKGHPLLITPALDAVRQWEYKPAVVECKPVEWLSEVSVQFRLGKQ